MMRRFTILLTASLSFFLLVSCKKSNIGTDIPEITNPIPVPPTDTVTTPIVVGRVIPIGLGSGNLAIDGNTLGILPNDQILIKGGTYTNINIKNVRTADGSRVYIKNDGLVEISGTGSQMRLSNLNNVTISGDGTKTISKGFSFRNLSNRAVQMDGNIDNFTFQHAYFENISDYVIAYNSNRVYNGSQDSYAKRLKFSQLESKNTASLIYFPAAVNSGGIIGLVKNLEISYIVFSNSPSVSSVVNLGAAEDYDIHHNVIKNINTLNNNHNGIFQLNGNGKFHNNLIRDHQGNAVRSWLFSVGSATKEVQIYNNIVFNSRKYSGFEVQGFSNLVVPGITSFANAKVFNNTCGSLNMSKDWVGVVVDVYDLKGGQCEVFNNLGYNFPTPSNNNMIWSQQSAIPAIASNNLYFADYSRAGLRDEVKFELSTTSSAKNAAITNKLVLTEDYYGNKRGAKYSVGAVE
ncbi:hypothetical protein [Pedobacter steynii]|nr:hypothetical protein [Pedobacter steynii]